MPMRQIVIDTVMPATITALPRVIRRTDPVNIAHQNPTGHGFDSGCRDVRTART